MRYDREVIAGNLRACRARVRMTQEDVAKAIGCSEATIQNYEAGTVGISYENAWALCDLFGISLDELGCRTA